jgi:hypothetical protein
MRELQRCPRSGRRSMIRAAGRRCRR